MHVGCASAETHTASALRTPSCAAMFSFPLFLTAGSDDGAHTYARSDDGYMCDRRTGCFNSGNLLMRHCWRRQGAEKELLRQHSRASIREQSLSCAVKNHHRCSRKDGS
jgi:hypothetical protein